jgi:hypothetical protein
MSALSWQDPSPSIGAATVAIATPSPATQYQINDFGNFTVVCLVAAGTKGGTVNTHIGDFPSLVEAKAAAQADWDSGQRSTG